MIKRVALAYLALLLVAGCVGVDGAPLAVGDAALGVDSTHSQPEVTSGHGTASPDTSAQEEKSHLLTALAYSPAAVDYLYFTDWDTVHQAMGLDRAVDTITDEWMLALNREHVAATVYAGYYQREHGAEWGWDTLDLEWEMQFAGGELPPVFVIKFHTDFDFAQVIGHLEARGFERKEHQGIVVYSHELDISQDWVRSTELAIHNMALLEDEGVMILSSSPGAVTAVLDALEDGGSLASDSGARAVARHLAAASSVVLLPRPDACLSFTPNPLLDAIGKADITSEDLLAEELPAQPQAIYTTLGLGYHYPGTGQSDVDIPYWLVVMHFLAPELAQADLAPRLVLAKQGMSQAADTPYSELFRVEASTLAGSDILLALAPLGENRSNLLLSMLARRDLLFATCP